jgi:hypothetical protein
MVLQGFGWSDIASPKPSASATALGVGRRPTFAESRFMAYNALMHGATAILYWGTAYAHKPTPDEAGTESRLWQDLLAVARELRALEPALIAPEVSRPRVVVEETFGSIDRGGVVASLRRVDSDWVLLVANENEDGAAFRVRGLPAAMRGVTLFRLGSVEQATVDGNGLRDGIRGFDVHVYATSRRFEAGEARQR